MNIFKPEDINGQGLNLKPVIIGVEGDGFYINVSGMIHRVSNELDEADYSRLKSAIEKLTTRDVVVEYIV